MQDMKQRTFQFSVEVGMLVTALPFNMINKAYGMQLIRSSSSVGANYRAARRAKSDADFLNKLKICEEEADESIYFLELLKVFNVGFAETIDKLEKEANELVKILVASIITTREKIKKQ
ncbi:MAG: four helix bundle protein [Chitinophagaceae bacterium]|nr:four helix bundle protein [Chitinophagaceae bacterium]